MSKEEPHKAERAMKIAVLVLIVALVAQALLLYHIFQKINDSRNQVENIRKAIQPSPTNSVTVPPPRSSGTVPQPANPVTKPIPRRITPVQSANCQSTLKPLPNLKQSGGTPTLNPNRPLRMAPSSSRGLGMMGGDPFKEMERMQQMMQQMMSRHGGGMTMGRTSSGFSSFGGSFGGGSSITTDNNNNYLITLRIPGLDKANIETRIDGNMLTVSSTSNSSRNQQGNQMVGRNQSFSQFQSSFSLPGPVQADKMNVDYKNDILTIKVPKA